MYCEKVKHEQETYTYYSWEPVTRTTGGDTEYHFYNPVTKQDYGWLSQDQENLSGSVLALPNRSDIDVPVNEMLIVELYSK